MHAIGRRRLSLSWFVLTACIFFLIISCGRPEAPSLGYTAPDFAASDLSGNEISLANYRGKVVLLDFWATWCVGCLIELPHVKRVYDTYKGNGFRVIGISQNQNQHDVEYFVRMVGIDWPQIFDGRGAIAGVYRVGPIPATFLIDKNGVIRYTNVHGQVELERAVRDLLGLPVNPPPAGAGGSRQPPSRG
jgi:peroxiredoxin